MRGDLTNEARLQISNTKLRNNNSKLRDEIKSFELIIQEKDKQIKKLELQLIDKESQRKELLTFLYKPKKKEGDILPKGKKIGEKAYHRAIPKEGDIDQVLQYNLNKCPICKSNVGEIVDSVIKYEEDIRLSPKPIIKKHIISRHWCKKCETYVKSNTIPDINRIGINTTGYILYSRYKLRLPFNKIKDSLFDLYNFKISEGEIVNQLNIAEKLFDKDYKAITILIQESNKIYADETGWRMNGENWWLWVFVNDNGVQYVIEDTRGKGVLDRNLGQKEDRVIISDGYAAYQNIPGDKQQCWVHLLRKAKLISFKLYEDLLILYKKLLLELEKPLKDRDRVFFENELEKLIHKKYSDNLVDKVQNRMKKHLPFLFTCLSYENILPENNTAERSIRHQVVMRKIFGGSRSLQGVKSHQVNTSVIETLKKQNPDLPFFDTIIPLLKKRHSGL